MKTLILFFKSHVDTYTRKDGSVVQAHDDKRTAAKKDWRDEENWHSRTQMKMETHSDDELRYIHKDATDAAEIGEKSGFDSKKTGQYRDEAHYAAMELKKRQDAKKPTGLAEDKKLPDHNPKSHGDAHSYGSAVIAKRPPGHWAYTNENGQHSVMFSVGGGKYGSTDTHESKEDAMKQAHQRMKARGIA